MRTFVEPARDCFVFDCDTRVAPAQAKALAAMGFGGCVRTVGIAPGGSVSDIDAAELDGLLSAGLGVMLYQNAHAAGWVPSSALGVADGVTAARIARAAGYLPGAHLWDDLEGLAKTATATETAAYANGKLKALQAQGIPQGEYVGYDVPMTGDELYQMMLASAYWHSISDVPEVTTRGYTMVQIAGDVVIAGQLVDVSIIRADRLGGRPMWMRGA